MQQGAVMAEEIEETKEEEKSTKKSSNLVLIIVIVVLVLTLLVGVALVFLMTSGDDSSPQMQQTQGMSNQGSANSRQVVARQDGPSLEVGEMYPLDPFTVNLLSDSGRRYLKTTMNLELRDREVSQELDKKAAVIRDVIIGILTSNTLESIATPKGKEKLKDDLVNQVNMRLRDGQIVNVYFVDFVIQ